MSERGKQGILFTHTDEQLTSICRCIVRDHFGVEVGLDEPLKGLGFDPLDEVELIMEIEDTFDVDVCVDWSDDCSIRDIMKLLRLTGL